MIDQSHNLKGKIEATVQTVVTAQELWLKAALVDREQLAGLQSPATWWLPKSFSAARFWRMCDRWPLPGDGRGLPAVRLQHCAKAAMSIASAWSAEDALPP